MIEQLDALAKICCEKNATLKACFSNGQITLNEFLDLQAEKIEQNNRITPLCNPEDFFSLAENFVAARLGNEYAKKVNSALRYGAACTADHHGGIYFAQSFQGDILFSFLLEKFGCNETTVPILSAGQVELENASYARGISAYLRKDAREFFPIFPSKYSVQLASYTEAINKETLKRFRRRFIYTADESASVEIREILDKILKEAYESEAVLSSECFSDQVTKIGANLTRNMFSDGKKIFIYLEMESLITPLVIKELQDKKSLISKLLFEPSVREKMLCEKLPEGTPLASLFFWGADEKGRKLHLTFLPEGELAGKDWRGQLVRYIADREALIDLITKRKIFPSVFTMALLTFFERGLTWLGGMFQSSYMPEQQQALVHILYSSGLKHEAQTIEAYDCSGYISGPVFFLYDGKDFSTPEGPVEAFKDKPSLVKLRELTHSTKLWDAHLMGLSDIYSDLIPRNLRKENWYSLIAGELYEQYPENRLTR